MKKTLRTALFLIAILVLACYGVSAETPTHLDRFKVKYTCAACHRGHGKRGTPMLRNDVPVLCYNCHGPEGYSYYEVSTQVYFDIQKRYHHPVDETARYHRQNEILPETDLSVERHVSCLDCHNPHLSTFDDPVKGVPGVSESRKRQKRAKDVNDVCLKCHSDNLTRPSDSPNVKEEFDTSNPSFHPVLGVARGRSVSVEEEMKGKLINCSDCHSPHGSDNEHMLKYTYVTTGAPESPKTYELCYKCHRRTDILSDRSFSEHKRHVLFEAISCRACHVAHGSAENERLIGFDPSIVVPNSSGFLMYEKSDGENRCFLSCHGADHRGNKVVKVE